MKDTSKRRTFFGKLIKTVAAIGLGVTHVEAKEKKEKVKLLTADGKLVEIDPEILNSIRKKSKTSNQEILDWTNQIKT